MPNGLWSPEHIRRNEPKFWNCETAKLKERYLYSQNPYKRFASVEIEVASVSSEGGSKLYDKINQWKGGIVYDGSLPRETGFEINTAPANGIYLVSQIREICDALNDGNAQINNQCGIHVHVDTRDFTYMETRKLILTIELLEDVMFFLVGPDRRRGHYCQPIGRQYADALFNKEMKVKHRNVAAVYGPICIDPSNRAYHDTLQGKINNAKRHKYLSPQRYMAWNFHSQVFRGTFEFRHYRGSLNGGVILGNAMLSTGIVQFAYGTTEAEIASFRGKNRDDWWGSKPSLIPDPNDPLYRYRIERGYEALKYIFAKSELMLDMLARRYSLAQSQNKY